MYRRISFYLILLIVLTNQGFSQTIKPLYSISLSSAYSFDEKKPGYFVNLNYEVSKDFFMGIKAGVYNDEHNLYDAFNDVFLPEYYEHQYVYGQYYLLIGNLKAHSPSYITALNGIYKFEDKLNFNFSAGIRYYQDYIYNINGFRYVIYKNSPTPVFNLEDTDDFSLLMRKDVLKGYFSIGADYRIKSFLAGIFIDNSLSLGINLGKEF